MHSQMWLLTKPNGIVELYGAEITVYESYDDHIREVKKQWQEWDNRKVTALVDAFDITHTWKYIVAKTAREALEILNKTPLLSNGLSPRSVYFQNVKDEEDDPEKLSVILTQVGEDEAPLSENFWRAKLPDLPDENPHQLKTWRVTIPSTVYYVKPVQ